MNLDCLNTTAANNVVEFCKVKLHGVVAGLEVVQSYFFQALDG